MRKLRSRRPKVKSAELKKKRVLSASLRSARLRLDRSNVQHPILNEEPLRPRSSDTSPKRGRSFGGQELVGVGSWGALCSCSPIMVPRGQAPRWPALVWHSEGLFPGLCYCGLSALCFRRSTPDATGVVTANQLLSVKTTPPSLPPPLCLKKRPSQFVCLKDF
jgi:hypothetical protein